MASPEKKKKPKRFFDDDDDDFFVMKPKKTKNPTVKPEEVKVEKPKETSDTNITIKRRAEYPPKLPLPPESNKMNLPSRPTAEQSKAEIPTSDDFGESFHTAQAASDTEEIFEVPRPLTAATEPIEIIEDGEDSDGEDSDGEDSDGEDSDGEFEELIKKHAAKNSDGREASRQYEITVTSKLGVEEKHKITCFGEETFLTVMERLKLQAAVQFVPFRLRGGYLIWIEGRLELKPFFRPSTLRIPEPSKPNEKTPINCLYVPESARKNFEEIYEEFSRTREAELEVSDDEDIEIVACKNGEDEKEEDLEKKSEYFVVGLKGKDNKRVEAEVGPQTKIRALLEHYLKTKGIDEKLVTRARLVFDDEDLNLDGVVGDTELEEDFEVQVYIN
uniref:Rad60/SUMO-like domain-containing protein n=1 Tax=Candidozyma auris TaxID=498019 RepID=A0A0L0P2P3_CANAR